MLKSKRILTYITASALSATLWTGTALAQENETRLSTQNIDATQNKQNILAQISNPILKDFKDEISTLLDQWKKVDSIDKVPLVFGGRIMLLDKAAPRKAIVIGEIAAPNSPPLKENTDTQENTDISNESSTGTEVIPSDNNPSNKNDIIKTGTVLASVLNIRSEAGTQNGVVGQLQWGQKVNITSQKDGWYKILLPDTSSGWVYSSYIAEDNTSTRGEYDYNAAPTTSEKNVPSENVSTSRQQVVDYAKKFLGIRYVYGGNTPSQGFDCSGYVKYVFTNFGINLERVAANQATQGTWVSKENLLPGDMVFFDTNGGHSYVNHAGIYIGDGMFIHSSSGSNRGVVISELQSGFYATMYMTGRRVLD